MWLIVGVVLLIGGVERDGRGFGAGVMLGDGRFRIESRLGEGAMGVVYKAIQISVGRPVAIKVLLESRLNALHARERFKVEAWAVAQIHHPNVVMILDADVTDSGLGFLVFEYLSGRSLASVRGRGIQPRRAVHIARQICGALGAAHRQGIVHRDLKPGNVQLIEVGGDQDFVKLLDFGIAKLLERRGDEVRLTAADQVLGTLRYMAPEQIRGREIDGRADLYSLGCVLFQLLAGRAPFRGASGPELIEQHLVEVPPRLGEVCPGIEVDPRLEAIVQLLLAKRPEDRIQSAEAVEAALAECLVGGAGSRGARSEVLEACELPVVIATRTDRPRLGVRGEDGSSVRDGVGSSVRDGVGASVRDGVGSSVRDGVGSSVRDGVGASVRDRVGSIVREGVGSSVRDGDGSIVREGVGSRVREGVGSRVREGVGSRVREGVGSRVREKAGALVRAEGSRGRVWILRLAAIAGGTIAVVLVVIAFGRTQDRRSIVIEPRPRPRVIAEPVPEISAVEGVGERRLSRPQRARVRFARIEVTPEATEREWAARVLEGRERELTRCFVRTQTGVLADRTLRLYFSSSHGRRLLITEPEDIAAQAFADCVRAFEPPLVFELSMTPAIAVVAVDVALARQKKGIR